MRKKLKKPRKKLKKFKKQWKTILVCVLSACILAGGGFVFFKTHQDASANFADYVMRPLIGSQATITIESLFFAAEDGINHVKYHFVKPDSQVFSDTKKKSVTIATAFTLTPIPLPKDALPGEGVWTSINIDNRDTLLAQTFLRPDASRDYAIAAIVKMNMQKLSVGAVAGTWEPGEVAKRGPGLVPETIQESNLLIAAFNGGFQKKDGAYGMIVGDETFLPLQNGLATLVLYANKIPQLLKYSGQKFGPDVTAIRQNGPMLIENGKVVTTAAAWNMQTWGLTTTNSMYTWRSGLGITKTGDLLYAVGPSLIPETLALSLQKAGAVNAMQLDINSVWVRFVLYSPLGHGKYNYQMLLKDMSNGGLSYLKGYQKDFFYVYKKPASPLADRPVKNTP